LLETGGKGGGYEYGGCQSGGGGGGYRAAVAVAVAALPRGGGRGAGSSFIASGATEGEVESGAGEAQKVLITYTVAAPPSCTKAFGRGVYLKLGQPGRINLKDSPSTNLAEPQKLTASYNSGELRFHLTKLESATCEGEADRVSSAAKKKPPKAKKAATR
jgi:hypothetical protein